ncbi:MAG: serine hydrolase [Acidobacteriia bacterium]|nr:serine hydrolase [Terriglobia bacterium]
MNPNISQSITVPSTDEIREILVRRIDQQKQAVGIVVGVIEPTGRRVVAYGNLANGNRPNGDAGTLYGDTIFEIGSVTKVFTSLLLADMVNRKEVALDDPAAKYLPENVKMPERSGKSITLHDLSTHSSGLPRLPSNLKPKDPRNPYADYSVDDLYQFLSGYTLPRDPGSDLEYSNLGAGLLGYLLACRAGTDYESLIGSRITEPLSMLDTGITLSSSMQQRMATGHNPRLAPVDNWDFPTLTGAGALRSSANDLLTFLEAFLGYKESPLAPAMKAMLEVRRTLGKANIGLGWFIFPTDGREIANHDGGTGGFCSWVGYDPKERIGVVVLSNTFTPSGVVDIGLHLLDPKFPLANPEPPTQRTEIPIDPKLLDNYTGRYQLEPNRTLEIIRDGDRLFAQGTAQVNGQAIVGPKFEVFAESEKNFFVKVTGSQITFETGPEGRATSLIMHRAGREPMAAPRLS